MVKLCIVLLFVAVTHLSNAQSQNTTCPTQCGPFECSSRGEKVWSIENRKCLHWPNQCQFDRDNCVRQNQCKKALVATTQESCIKRCRKFCNRIYKPVCATFLDEAQEASNVKKVTFNNRCLFDKHVCRNGETLVDSTKDGACPE